ncbi:hypothetical protein KC352_g34914, partial [Hortaea werneckii]
DGVADLISNGVDNAPTGSIVSVTQTSVGATVYATNGGEISGLQINPVEGANAPGSGGNGGSGLSTGAASSRTATSSSGGSSSTQTSSGSEASNTSGGSSTSTGSGSSDESSTATSSGSAASSTESEGTAFRVDGKMASSAGLAAAIGAVAFAL